MTTSARRPLLRDFLAKKSLEVILGGQTREGAYLACPDFPTYRYCWFRDGAFIAQAMDDWGQTESAQRFHQWVVRTLLSQEEGARLANCESELDHGRLLHTRYCADGSAGSEEWPNFQLDGLGTWLWSFGQHLSRRGSAPDDDARKAVALAAEYLIELWCQPNFDCWEEHADLIHPLTLGAVYAGILASAKLLDEPHYDGAARAIRSFLLTHGVKQGAFSKHLGSEAVDASLLWLATVYGVVPPTHPLARRTTERVRNELLDPEGGVHRYREDTYYGGGSWIILTAALASQHIALGDRGEAERLLGWIEAQATVEGLMPEQTARFLNDPSRLAEWRERWGESACPLLWSHAAYLSLLKRLEKHEQDT